MKNLPNIYIIGNKQSGKSTIAKHLEDKYNYKRYSFAFGVKLLSAYAIKGILFSNKPVEYFLENILSEEYPKEMSFSEESGKKEASYLSGLFSSSRFIIMDFLGTRGLMQCIGDGARRVIGENVWIDSCLKKIHDDKVKGCIDPFVIDDCRYLNEYVRLKKEYGDLIKGIFINKPGSDGDHPSEKCQENALQKGMKFDLMVNYSDGKENVLDAVDKFLETYIKQQQIYE